MAKLSRKQRKQIREKGQVVIKPKKVKIQPPSGKEYSKPSSAVKKAKTKLDAKIKRENLRRRKIVFLRDQGIDPFKYRKKDIDSIKIKDITSGNFNANTYPIFFADSWETVKYFGGQVLLISWCDFSGNRDIADIVAEVSGWSIQQILDTIRSWLFKKQTAQKHGSHYIEGTSSGSAGESKVFCADSETIAVIADDLKEKNKSMRWKPKRGKWKTHSGGDNIGWQNITGNNNYGFTECSAKTMIVICASILPNILETDREIFYRNWWHVFIEHFPEHKEDVPKPL